MILDLLKLIHICAGTAQDKTGKSTVLDSRRALQKLKKVLTVLEQDTKMLDSIPQEKNLYSSVIQCVYHFILDE